MSALLCAQSDLPFMNEHGKVSAVHEGIDADCNVDVIVAHERMGGEYYKDIVVHERMVGEYYKVMAT